MKKLFLTIIVFCGALRISASNPNDTLKVYYLNEVVVSSSVKETNAPKTLPAAVSTLSPRQLRDARIESLPRLSAFIPNFFIPSYGAKVSAPVYIRGVGARLGAQTVSLYVDNVPCFNPSSFDFEFQDIQRIEVLRGAQGTLYGRNAVGGIVNVYTLSPLSFQGTALTLEGGNYGQFAAKGSDYRKLSDRLGLSVAGYYKRNDGYFTNSYTGKKADASENAGGRVKLEWQAAPSLKALFFGNFDYVADGAFPYMLKNAGAVNFNEPSSYDRRLLTHGLSLDYTGKGYTIHSTTGFQYLNDDMKMDQDYTPKQVFSINHKQKQYSVSQEVTVKGDAQRNYRWVIGAFGFYDNREVDTHVALKKDALAAMRSYFSAVNDNPRIPVTIEFASQRIDLPGIYKKPSRGAALFHQSTLDNLFGLNGLSATAGIRLDYEHTGIDFSTQSDGGDVVLTITPPRGNPQIIPVEGDTLLHGVYRKEFWKILPKFALQYRTSPASQIYLSASKGYKTGGYNEQLFSKIMQDALRESVMRNALKYAPAMPGMPATPSAPLKEQLSYNPETSWTYELGGRYETLNKSLSLTCALFYMHVNDLQLIELNDQATSGRTVTNAGKSESKGFELSVKYAPAGHLSLSAEYGFADARFTNGAGNHVPFAPRHTLSLGAGYERRFRRGALIDRLAGNIRYQGVGKIYWDFENTELRQPFYGLTNAGISAEKGAFALECWVENLFNTKYDSFLFEAKDMTTGSTNTFVQRGYPTRFGATLRYTLHR
jgi:outer membrane receptor protein involved in Fe transport